MILSNVKDSLKVRLENDLKPIKLMNEKGEYVPVNIKKSEFPQRNTTESLDTFPYVLIKTYKGDGIAEEDTISLMLLLGTVAEADLKVGTHQANAYKNYEDAHEDILRLIQNIRKSFRKNNVLDNMYTFKDPFKWEIYIEQPYPYIYGEIVLTFKLPETEVEEDF